MCGAKNTVEKDKNCIPRTIKEVMRNKIKVNIKLNSRALKNYGKERNYSKKFQIKDNKTLHQINQGKNYL